MTWKDILEIGLKENAPYRKDNLPPNEVVGPEVPQGPGRSAEIPRAREHDSETPAPSSESDRTAERKPEEAERPGE
jgi:hypothetical protein